MQELDSGSLFLLLPSPTSFLLLSSPFLLSLVHPWLTNVGGGFWRLHRPTFSLSVPTASLKILVNLLGGLSQIVLLLVYEKKNRIIAAWAEDSYSIIAPDQ